MKPLLLWFGQRIQVKDPGLSLAINSIVSKLWDNCLFSNRVAEGLLPNTADWLTLTSHSHLRSSRPPPVSAGRCPVSPERGPAPPPPAGSYGSEMPPRPLPATAHKRKKEKGWGWGKGHSSGNMLLTQKEGSCLGWPRLYTGNQLYQSNYFNCLLAFDLDHNVLKSFANNPNNVFFPCFHCFRLFSV